MRTFFTGVVPYALFAIALLAAQSARETENKAASDSSDVLLQRALTLARSNHLDDAKRILLEGKSRYPGNKRFPQELAGIEYRKKNIAGSKAYLREALQDDAADNYANDFLGSLYLLDSNLPAALKYWNRIDKPLLQTVRFAPTPPLDSVLRERTFAVSAGQILTRTRLRQTEAGVEHLGIFSDCGFDLSPRSDQRFDLTIRAIPIAQPLRGWPGRLLPALRGLPYQSVYLDSYNIGRRAINFTSLWRWDRDKRRVSLDVSGLLRMWRYHLLVDARDEIWDLAGTYTSTEGNGSGMVLQKLEGGADIERDLSPELSWTIGTRVAGRRFRNADNNQFFSNGWSFDVRNRFDYLLIDWPEERARVDAWARLRAGRILTAFPSRLVSVEGGLKSRWLPEPKGERYMVAAEVRAGGIVGNVPSDELFVLGMERDNDLWLRGHVGTRDGRKGSAPMGRNYVLTKTELQRVVLQVPFVHFQLGPFFDSGWTGDSSGRFGSRKWLFDSGLQAIVGTLGKVTFSAVYGRNLREGRSVFYTAISR